MERKDTYKTPRGTYKKAEEGWTVPGVNVPYEDRSIRRFQETQK